MRTSILHTLTAAAVIGGAASLALAFDRDFDIGREGPDKPPRFQGVYKYKVKGSKAKGSEKYHMSVGDCYVTGEGVAALGSLEASRHDRSAFNFYVFAPVGDGASGTSSVKIKLDTAKSDAESSASDREEFGYALQQLDDDIGGTSNAATKKPPVGVNGIFRVDRLRVKGSVRMSSQEELSGSIAYSATGVITTGEDAEKSFKASFKTRFKNAPAYAR